MRAIIKRHPSKHNAPISKSHRNQYGAQSRRAMAPELPDVFNAGLDRVKVPRSLKLNAVFVPPRCNEPLQA